MKQAYVLLMIAAVACGKGDNKSVPGGGGDDRSDWGDCATLLTADEVKAACGTAVTQSRWYTQATSTCVRVYRDSTLPAPKGMDRPVPTDILLNVFLVSGDPNARAHECGATKIDGIGEFACENDQQIEVDKGRFHFWIGMPARTDDTPRCAKYAELARLVASRLP